VELNKTNFYCDCIQGRIGIHCELMINYCRNVTCLNKGICQPLLVDYKCECLSGSSGRHCEQLTTSIIIRQYVAKGFAYIAIIAILTDAGFIIVLDILKYGFGIDLTRKERAQIWRKRVLHEQINREKQKSYNSFRLRCMHTIVFLPQLQESTFIY
jgi:hypothetical protein